MFNTGKTIIISIAAVFFMFLMNATVATSNEKLVEVTAYTLNVREAPSARSPIKGQVRKGDQFTVTSVSKHWAEIVSGDKTKGFISTKHVRLLEQESAKYEFPLLVPVSIGGAVFLLLLVLVRLNKRRQLDKTREPIDAISRKPPTKSRSVLHKSSMLDEVDEHHKDIHDFPIAKVVRVIDGDTVIVSSPWRQTKIRLDSIDCPEDGQPWGNIATSGLIKLIGGKKVRIQVYGNDHYGREIATIYVQEKLGADWINVNEQMVVKGHAWVMRKYYEHLPKHQQDKLNRLERWARNKRVGLWKTPNPVPPWLWRHNQRSI